MVSRSIGRLWLLRAVALLSGLGGVGLLTWYASVHQLPMMVMLALAMVVILLAVGIAVFAEVTFQDGPLDADDALLVHRLKTSSARHIGVLFITLPLILATWWLARQYWHLSLLETLLLVNLPGIAVGGIARKIWPVAAGSDAETVRASLLLVDRARRQQAFGYATFAAVLAFNILMVAPQIGHALHGQPIRLGDFDVLGIGGLVALFFLSQPWNWFETRSVRRVAEDESLARFRLLAYRNGFLVMALGLVLACDAVGNPPRLAVVLIPVVLNAGLMVSLLTLVWLEYRAGTFVAPYPDAESEILPIR